MLALLALSCFPVLAHADSSGIQYTDAPPTVTGTKAPKHSEPPANKSNAKTGGESTDEGKGRPNNPHSSEKEQSAGGSPGSGGGNGSNGQSGGQGQGGQGSGQSTAEVGGAQPVSSQGDSSSSPLVPILIAIAVLAAISVGTVVVRQRRRGNPGSSVSPEAG
ncbi:MAG TPA: hypothetical protein VN756_12590 [Solirubrobacterales bacterium]|nr:hypothetical protein [Solirubrobacterales bacterium]